MLNQSKNFSLLSLCLVIGLFASCKSTLKPLSSQVVQVTPQPLELIGTKVPATINATFPAQWFNKKATLTVTPVLRYANGEAVGTPYSYQGEKVAGNGQTIPAKEGANVTLKSSFDYVSEMRNSQLFLTFDAKIGKKSIALPDLEIGQGVLATAALINPMSEQTAIAADGFQRVIKEAYDANILFLIQQAELRSTELKKGEVVDWKDIVASAAATENQKVDIEISAYASPDGGYDLNEKLAGKRESVTKEYLSKELKKSKIQAPINARYTAQDWEGFKILVEKSNIQDKDLILRVLSMYSDSEQREREIKNISTVYSDLAETILPQLRRSRLTANIEIIGKSDDEIVAAAQSNPRSLSVEELLYAATLAKTDAEKEALYKKVTEIFPNDARGFNNLGAVQFAQGKITDAEKAFKQALKLSSNLPEANYNAGWVALTEGDTDTASQFFGKSAGVPQLNNAMAYLDVLKGNYTQAAKTFGQSAGNNAAVAQILAKDYNAAQTALDKITSPDADTYYLKAIVAARTNNLNSVVENLKQSVALDANKATQALSDTEFAKYAANAAFLKAVVK
ncbi:MAG: tetratricopeptide repeat protein [Candidatus Symbiothrix sp.]|jgi:Flp pilus assembly protein TadD|nr:tetratricopeptide repeat protein [Candidatus Symbiothrix sp.]